MILSFRHFLWAVLFGFLVSFQAFSSGIHILDESNDEVETQLIRRNADQVELDDLYRNYRRLSWWSRGFDITADVLRISGRVIVLGGGITTFVSALGSGFLELAGRAESGGQSKSRESRGYFKKIRELEVRRFDDSSD